MLTAKERQPRHPKPVVVWVLSERMPDEDWLTVSVYRNLASAEAFAAELARANGPTHQTRIEPFNVVEG